PTVTMGWLVERVPAIVLSHTIDVRIRVSRYEAVTDANRWIEAQSVPPLVYTVAEVAARLKVSPGTVRNMIDQGQLYAVRLHLRRIVVPKWAVDELVARPSNVVAHLHRQARNA
ncbi:MAG: helix-turn-helix domain-containing protein, partial [Actinomycetota bacterium]|nr:helix-turn-helix domain-containing protein [Actinomycetota bacterium]